MVYLYQKIWANVLLHRNLVSQLEQLLEHVFLKEARVLFQIEVVYKFLVIMQVVCWSNLVFLLKKGISYLWNQILDSFLVVWDFYNLTCYVNHVMSVMSCIVLLFPWQRPSCPIRSLKLLLLVQIKSPSIAELLPKFLQRNCLFIAQ